MKAIIVALSALWLALAGCQPAGEEPGQPADQPQEQDQQEPPGGESGEAPATADAPQSDEGAGAGMPTEYAEAEILPTEGQKTGGLIKLSRAGGEVRMEGTVTGLTPGPHGFHIHEKGDCSAPDATSAGDHFEPAEDPHGAPEDPPDQHHLGDFGNIMADENGEAEINMSDPELEMSGPDSVIGKAFIVHAGQDDLTSQPSGNAGARVGCGVIRALEVAESGTTTL